MARKFNLITGYGGVGKGQVMADLIARGSRGRPMPGQATGQRFRTLILAAEDDPHEDIRPCLDANGADLHEINILDGVQEPGQGLAWVNVTHHMPVILDPVRSERIDLPYPDPLSGYTPGVKRQSGGDVRDTLGHIQRLINAAGVTVIGTLHFGKAQDRRGAMRILDSVEFANAARNVIGVNDLPRCQPTHRRARRPATRSAQDPGGAEVAQRDSGGAAGLVRPRDAAVQWHGESPVSFDETFRAPATGQRGEDAIAFVKESLKGGSQASADLTEAAKANGISERTLRRAKAELKIIAFKPRHQRDGKWYWRLPDGTGEAG